MSIAEGIRTRVINEWLSSGLMTSLSVTPEGAPRLVGGGGPRRGRRNRGRPAPDETAPARSLDDTVVSEISRIPGVRRVWPVITRPVEILRATVGDPPDANSVSRSSSAARSLPSGHAPAEAGAGLGGGSRAVYGGGTAAESAHTSDQAIARDVRPANDGETSQQARGRPASAKGEERPADIGESGTGAEEAKAENARNVQSIGKSRETIPQRSALDASQQRSTSGSTNDGRENSPGAEYATLRGLSTDFFWREDYIKITAGEPLSRPEAFEVLVSADRIKSLGFEDEASALGKTILVRWREAVPAGSEGAEPARGLPFALKERSAEFKIVGTFENRGALSLRAAGIIVPTARAEAIATLDPEQIRALFTGGPVRTGYPGLDVYLTPGADLEAIEKKIKEMGFQTLSGAEIASRIRRSMIFLQAFLGGLGTIAIAVATLGIANTLLTAVYERTREIGVMKAVGARRRDIRRQFFAEAGLIGVVGGFGGIIAGFAADHILGAALREFARRQGADDPGAIAVHTVAITLGCLAFSIGLSLLAGTYPAARAARLDPVVTLRHE